MLYKKFIIISFIKNINLIIANINAINNYKKLKDF